MKGNLSLNNILDISSNSKFRFWLKEHSSIEKECWIHVKKGRPLDDGRLYYLDCVETALCFGWIDSVHREINGKRYQRFTPRTKNSPWSELNKERCRRLIKLGLMEESGYKALPPLGPRSFKIDFDIEQALKDARVYSKFKSFHPLYQRIRAYNVFFYKKRNPNAYNQALKHLIEETKQGKMFGEWNDYGRLLNY